LKGCTLKSNFVHATSASEQVHSAEDGIVADLNDEKIKDESENREHQDIDDVAVFEAAR
jgi:hypothetical protein